MACCTHPTHPLLCAATVDCYTMLAGLLKCVQAKQCDPFIVVIQQPWQREFIAKQSKAGKLDVVRGPGCMHVRVSMWIIGNVGWPGLLQQCWLIA